MHAQIFSPERGRVWTNLNPQFVQKGVNPVETLCEINFRAQEHTNSSLNLIPVFDSEQIARRELKGSGIILCFFVFLLKKTTKGRQF